MFNWSDKIYKWVKWSVLLLIPTLGLAYQKLGAIWNFPMIEQIKATIDVVVYCLAVILGINCAEYDSTKAKLQKALDSVEAKAVEKKVVEAKTEAVTETKSEEPAEEKKEEATPEPTVSDEDNGIVGTCICEVGKEYELLCNLKVRDGAGTDARWKDYNELSEDGKRNAVEGEKAVLKAGCSVTCLEVKANWIRIPSGWICVNDGEDCVKPYEASKWQFPVNYVGISGSFNSSHLAYDFGFSDNPYQPILAPCQCTVSACGWNDVVGNYVFANFNHNGQDYTWRFIHMSEISVSVGQSLSQGQQIGLMGATGSSSTGNYHLHMDLWRGTYAGSMPSDRAGASVDYLSLLYLYSHQSVGDVTDATYRINRA